MSALTQSKKSCLKKTCTYCLKKYTNKTSLDKHILICSLLYKSKRQLKIEEEESNEIPTYQDLCEIIKELLLKVKKLEEKGEIYDKYINKMKKKINIIDWLNNHLNPNIYWEDFINKFTIKEEDILFMMNNTFIDTLFQILNENINYSPELINISSPIFCSDHKINTIYAFQKDKKWAELNKKQLIEMFNILYFKIFKNLLAWKQQNEDLLNRNEGLENIYMKTMGKILSVDFNNETFLSKAKTCLYNITKTEKQKIVEYEFI